MLDQVRRKTFAVYAALRGMPRAPEKVSVFHIRLPGCKGAELSEYCQHINMRITADEKDRVTSLAKSNGMSVSQFVRVLIKLPDDYVSGNFRTAIVIDRTSVPRLEREMRRWGNHYNQAVHALNRIAYYAERGSLSTDEAHRLLGKTSGNLDDLNVAVIELRNDVKEISSHAIVSI